MQAARFISEKCHSGSSFRIGKSGAILEAINAGVKCIRSGGMIMRVVGSQHRASTSTFYLRSKEGESEADAYSSCCH